MMNTFTVDPSFERIPDAKRERIIACAMAEFAEHGYTAASTNSIVKNAGISKGSLFKYFASKDVLYLYIAEIVLSNVMPVIKEKCAGMPSDILVRLGLLAEAVVNIYVDNPQYYRFFMGILDAGAVHLQQTLLAKNAEQFSFLDLFSGVDTSKFRYSEETSFLLIKWLFTGIKQELFEIQEVIEDPVRLREEFKARIGHVVEALKTGIYK